MAGQIKRMIDSIVQQRAKGNPVLEDTTRIKLTIKGVDPTGYNSFSPDDPAIIAQLKTIAVELGIRI
jgi:hypothetical protein